jgi:hypothetical protein
MKIKLIIILYAISFNVIAQTEKDVKSIFGNGKLHSGYFLTPSVKSGNIAGSTNVITGIGAGVIFNNKFSLDGSYRFTVTENSPAGEDPAYYLHGRWFGLGGEYTVMPEKIIHLGFPVEVGLGEIELDVKDSFENMHMPVIQDEAWFFNIEPAIALEVNVWKYIKLNFKAGYRFVSNINFRNITEKDLAGVTFSLGIKAGIF